MVRNLLVFVVWGWVVVGLNAQEGPAPTPREVWDRVQVQVAQDHVFTPEEVAALAALEEQLAGDGDLGTQVHLLRLALATRAATERARSDTELRLSDEAAWQRQETFLQNQGVWRFSRDAGLWAFGVSTVSILGLTATLDRLDNSGSDNREDLKTALRWTLAGSVATAVLSLFPLAWGETRQ